MFANESEAYADREAYDSASVVPILTRSELSSDSDSAYDSASVASVASVNQPLKVIKPYRNTEMIVRLAGNDFVRPAV